MSRKMDPNKYNIMFAQLLGTRDFISFSLGKSDMQFVSYKYIVALMRLCDVDAAYKFHLCMAVTLTQHFRYLSWA